MKKLVILGIALAILMLHGCVNNNSNLSTTEHLTSAIETQVRIIRLDYTATVNMAVFSDVVQPSQLSYKTNYSVQELDYIFPEEILIFTVIIEDPNYEFVSLLSLNFNGEIIRANTDDSIVETRDCGENISSLA